MSNSEIPQNPGNAESARDALMRRFSVRAVSGVSTQFVDAREGSRKMNLGDLYGMVVERAVRGTSGGYKKRCSRLF